MGAGLADNSWPQFQRNNKRSGAWPSFTISVIIEPNGAGEVSGAGIYNPGATATLNVTSNTEDGYNFEYWSNGQTGSSNPLVLEVTSDLTLTANFGLVAHNLVVNAGTGGTATGSGNIPHGTLKTITATPSTGYSFTGWSGTGITDSSSATTTVNMTLARTVTANFSLNSNPNTHSVTIVTIGEGNVTGEGNYSFGDSITLTASAESGNYFEKWSGSGIEDSNSTSLTITVTENLTFTASFITSPTNLSESLQVTIISPSWYANDWLGYFYQSGNGWCYHYNLGWIFPETQSDGSMWLWSPQLKWLWLNSDSFTKQQSWAATDENWIYFDFESLPSPRFFRYKDEKWSSFDKNQ